MEKRRVLVLASGGVDSTVLAAHLKDAGDYVEAVSVDYGQLAFMSEFRAAKVLLGGLEVPLRMTRRGKWYEPMQDGYTVPARNLMLVSIGVAEALSSGCDTVALGCCGADQDHFPDCRRGFLECLTGAVERGCGVSLTAPFQAWDKSAIWRRGEQLGLNLAVSWSCYTAGPEPCWDCLACKMRGGPWQP